MKDVQFVDKEDDCVQEVAASPKEENTSTLKTDHVNEERLTHEEGGFHRDGFTRSTLRPLLCCCNLALKKWYGSGVPTFSPHEFTLTFPTPFLGDRSLPEPNQNYDRHLGWSIKLFKLFNDITKHGLVHIRPSQTMV